MKKYVLSFLLAILFIGHGTAQTDLQTWVNQRQYEKVLAQSMLMDMDTLDYANLSAIGQAYEGLLRYKEAYRIYERCLSMDSSRVDALNSLARTAMSLGKMRVAEDCFQKTLAMDSMNFYANYQLARVYALQGNYERAIGQYNVLNQMDTTFVNPIVYNNMADCYQRLNDLPSATLCYLRAYQANKENAGIANSLVTCMWSPVRLRRHLILKTALIQARSVCHSAPPAVWCPLTGRCAVILIAPFRWRCARLLKGRLTAMVTDSAFHTPGAH